MSIVNLYTLISDHVIDLYSTNLVILGSHLGSPINDKVLPLGSILGVDRVTVIMGLAPVWNCGTELPEHISSDVVCEDGVMVLLVVCVSESGITGDTIFFEQHWLVQSIGNGGMLCNPLVAPSPGF